MHKKDIQKINKNTYFYKDDSGVTLYFDLSFIYESTRLNDLKADILSKYMCTINSIYKTRKDIDDKRRELYNIGLSSYSSNYDKDSLLYFTFNIIDPKAVKDDYFDDAIEFISDIFYKPYFIDGKLDHDRLDTIKKDIYNVYINMVKEFNYDSYNRYKKVVQKEAISNRFLYDSKEELEEELNSITDKDLIDFYNMLLESHYKTVFVGNYTKEQINKVLSKFKFKNSINKKVDYEVTINLKSEYNEYISKDYSQSILYFTYNIKDRKKFSNKCYSMINNHMLNSGNGLLMEILRTKYGLVYSSMSYISPDTGIFAIEAYIDRKNKDKTIEAIKELFSDLHNKKIIDEKLKYAKSKIKETVYLSDELPSNVFGKVNSYIYRDDLTDSGLIRKINQITTNDILELFDNLENENIYFYVGDKDE